MLEKNPYANGHSAPSARNSQDQVPAVIVDVIRRTSGWTGFASITFWGLSVLMVFLAVSPATTAQVGRIGSDFNPTAPLAHLFLAVCYIYPAIKLSKFTKYSNRLTYINEGAMLLALLDQQRLLWKYFGITTIISLVFVVLFGISFTIS